MLQHKLRGYWGASPRNSWNSRRYVLDINYKGGGPPVPLTVGVDFAAPLLVHVGRVDWVKVSRPM